MRAGSQTDKNAASREPSRPGYREALDQRLEVRRDDRTPREGVLERCRRMLGVDHRDPLGSEGEVHVIDGEERVSALAHGGRDRLPCCQRIVEHRACLVAEDHRPGARRRAALLLDRRFCRRARVLGHLARVCPTQREHPLDERDHPVRAEHAHHRIGVDRAPQRELDVALDGSVRTDRGDLAAHARVLGVLAQVLAHLAGNLLGVVEHRIERTVLLDELGGRLLADARHAGDVVGGVALQAEEVGDLVGADAEPLLDAERVVDRRSR